MRGNYYETCIPKSIFALDIKKCFCRILCAMLAFMGLPSCQNPLCAGHNEDGHNGGTHPRAMHYAVKGITIRN